MCAERIMTVSAESEAIEAELPQLPLKSRCLRQSSVAKRLRLETSKGAERAKTRGIKKRLSRYRRKTENAKERERMKKFNEAFENLRQKLPNRDLLSEKSVAGEKDTKVILITLTLFGFDRKPRKSLCVSVCLSVIFVHYPLCRSGRYFVLF